MTPFRSATLKARALTSSLKSCAAGTLGMSTQLPSTSNFQP